MAGLVAPALANLSNPLTVSVQSGVLTAGTAGSATYTVTVNRNSASPADATLTIAGLTSGASYTVGTPSAWSSSGAGSRTYPLTIATTIAAAAGTTQFTVTASASGATQRSGTGTLTIAAGPPQAPTITFAAAPTPTYLGGNFTVSATTNSNGARTYSYVSGPCAVVSAAAGTFSSSGAGACVVRVDTALTATFLAGSAQQTVTIAAATPTITFAAAPVPEFPPAGSFTVSASTNSNGAKTYGLVSGATCLLTSASAGTFSYSGTGACVVQVSTAATSNFLAGSAQQTVNVYPPGLDLYAIAGTTTLPDGTPVPVWGYNSSNAAVAQPGGRTLFVNQGDTVVIKLHNQLTTTTSLLVQGQDMVPDTNGVAPGATKVYTFTANRPGTYLYEAGLLPNAQHQVAMGLYGAFVVRPIGAPLQAYADVATAFNDEAVLVLSEVDPALNGSANPAAFDMRTFAPRYFLINGKAYPATDPILATVANSKVLLRYVNAGVRHHSMAVLGLRQNFIAKDGGLLPTLSHNVAAETLAPGQTADAVVSIPAVASTSRFAVYDGNLMLRNGSAPGFGGMLTFVTAGVGGTGTPPTGPTASAVSLAPNPTNGSAAVVLSASFSPATTSAEYFIDATGANGSGVAMGGSGTARTATISTATLAGLAPGNHTIFVHGTDGTTWGGFGSATLNLDKAGPATTGLTLTPNPSNGSVAVALHGTGDDTASGGSNITAAEYFVGAPGANGSGTAMTVNTASPVASVDAAIAAPVTGGVISVHSRDALGNWGAFSTITLSVVGAGPSTSNVTAVPNPNNGAVPLNASQAVVRVTATVVSAGATVAAAEGFIDSVGAPGSGFAFVPSDGAWNGSTEVASGDIPLGTVAGLASGNHTIYVRGRDATGNWGPTGSTVLVIDKTAPTVSVSAAASTVAFGSAVTVNVTANDVGSGVAVRQYWVDGSATPPASPTAFSGSTFNVAGLAGGAHTIYVRVQDAATNWSAVASVTVTVVQAVNDARSITANGNATQNSDASGGTSVLNNDLPTGAGRTARLFSAPVRTSGTGTGTIALSCPGALGTAAAPAVGGQTICTNGAYRVTLTGVGGSNAARAASKRGTFQFTYTEIFNGVTSNAVVTLTVN